MNKWIGIGRLTKDPELDIKDTYKMARFTLAVNRPYQKDKEQKTDFLMCKAFGSTAEFISKWFKKGDPVVVTDAAVQTHSSMKDGITKYYTDILVNQVEFAPTKKSEPKGDVYEQEAIEETPDETTDEGYLPF